METTTRRPRRLMRALLAVLLCLACIPAQALVSAGTAHADGTELYAVVYKETGQKYHTLVFQNTPDAQEGYGAKKAHYPVVGSWSAKAIDSRYPIGRVDVDGEISAPKVTKFSFENCEHLATADLRGLHTPNLFYMRNTFYDCTQLESVNLSGLDLGYADEMYELFYLCNKLRSVDMTNINCPSLTSMNGLFEGACDASPGLTVDFSGTDTSRVTNMTHMFDLGMISDLDLHNPTTYCHRALTVKGLSTSSAEDMSRMLAHCDLTRTDLSFLDTSNAVTMSGMFCGSKLEGTNLSSIDTSSVTDMSSMFLGCDLSNVDLGFLDTSNVLSMRSMFSGYKGKSLVLPPLDTSNVEDMSSMFNESRSLEKLDLSQLDTSNVSNMQGMFFCCESLKSLDLSTFDMSSVENMSSMFGWSGAAGATFGPECTFNTRGWTTPKLKEADGLFTKSLFTSIDMRGIDLSQVSDLNAMFEDCLLLEVLDLSSVNTRKTALDPNWETLIFDFWNYPNIGSIKTVKLGANTQLGQLLPSTVLWRSSQGKAFKASQIPSFKADTYTPIRETDLFEASVSVPSKTYTGKTLKPSSVVVKLGGITLKQGTDFTVSCAGGKKVGSYKVTIKGKSPFSGTKTATFKIVPKGTSVSKLTKASKGFTVTWKKPSAAARSQIDGYQVRYATASSMKGAKTATVKGAAKTSAKVAKLKGNKTYYVQVRSYKKVSGKTYYSAWSATKSVKTKK